MWKPNKGPDSSGPVFMKNAAYLEAASHVLVVSTTRGSKNSGVKLLQR